MAHAPRAHAPRTGADDRGFSIQCGMTSQSWLWGGFAAIVFGMLALDLGVFNRKAHVVRTKEAAAWSAAWVSLALIFGVGVYFTLGRQPALEFAAG